MSDQNNKESQDSYRSRKGEQPQLMTKKIYSSQKKKKNDQENIYICCQSTLKILERQSSSLRKSLIVVRNIIY